MNVPEKKGLRLSIALVHTPVYDKHRQVVTTAVTNLDIHDIARAARTYGLGRYYVVTPVPEQQALTERVVAHWREGWGAGYNPDRKEALELVRVVPDLAVAVTDLAIETGSVPRTVVTSARSHGRTVSYASLRELLTEGRDELLLVFGTGWGVTEAVVDGADLLLQPIRGGGDYNHLSVRSAVAIILDRLVGERES